MTLHSLVLPALCLTVSVAEAEQVTPAPESYTHWAGVWSRVRGLEDEQPPAGVTVAAKERPQIFRADWLASQADATAELTRLQNRGADCVLTGMPAMMSMVYLMETLVNPHMFMIVSEYQSSVRRIYLDGRGHPSPDAPTFNGHSVGRWEGDTLIVDTVAIRPLPYGQGILSDATHVTEAIRMLDENTLEDVITLEDPKALLRPVVTRRLYAREKDAEINEYVCEQNNHNATDESGKPTYGR